jgi:hypothetical protein
MARKRKQPDGWTQKATWLSLTELNPRREADYIIQRAQERDARLVRHGPFVFFSTAGGDAWMLDLEDALALCLARDGERQPFRIFETSRQFGVEWHQTYRIDGELFITEDRSGHVTTMMGYPTREILDFSGTGDRADL